MEWIDILRKVLVLGNVFMWGLVPVIGIRNEEEAVRHFSLGKQGRACPFPISSSPKRQENAENFPG